MDHNMYNVLALLGFLPQNTEGKSPFPMTYLTSIGICCITLLVSFVCSANVLFQKTERMVSFCIKFVQMSIFLW